MDARYEDKEISRLWSKEMKLAAWERTELAVLQAKAELNLIERAVFGRISERLRSDPPDVQWWLEREKETQHDLAAFVDERRRFLSIDQGYFHQNMTSYDTEEAPFALKLKDSCDYVKKYVESLKVALKNLALTYRHTMMLGYTHGQPAELQSFGKRCLTWLQAFMVSAEQMGRCMENLKFSRLAGAIGNYTGISPEVERRALEILGLKPFYGATQIMPRELYAPLAESLFQLVSSLNKIATDIRLGARGLQPICREPFGKKQKGSSAMPHKQNTIATERMEGMERMAEGYCLAIMRNIMTWEERDISQSCVERVAWLDLFHVVVHCLNTMTKVLQGLRVYPDHMILEVNESRGCYASVAAKEFLAERGAAFGILAEDAYRIVQLAAFNVFEPQHGELKLREFVAQSWQEADCMLGKMGALKAETPQSIREIIGKSQLRKNSELDADEAMVSRWNANLQQLFAVGSTAEEWNNLFRPSHLLRNEAHLFQQILGE